MIHFTAGLIRKIISNGKAMMSLLIVGLIKKILLHKISCFPKPDT